MTRQEEIDALYDLWELLLPGQPASLLVMDRLVLIEPDANFQAAIELNLLRRELDKEN